MRTRNWSIRSKIIAMITVPLVALLALWLFVTALTAGPALDLLSTRTLVDSVGTRGETLITELQAERRVSVQYLSDTTATTATLTPQRADTDKAINDFRQAARGGDAWRSASDTLRARINQVFTDLNSLVAQRGHIDRRDIDPIGAQNLYNAMVGSAFAMFAATATFPDDEINRQIRALATIGRGQEYLARVDSLLAGATVYGHFTDDLRAALVQDVGTARFLLAGGVDELPEAGRVAYEKLSSADALTQLNRMMDRLVTESRSGDISPVGADSWHPAYIKSADQLRDFEDDATAALADRAKGLAIDIIVRLALAALLGLAALVVSVWVSVKVGRSMVGRLRRLRGEALEMATERLPNVVRRLQRGENVDVAVETPPLEYGRDEIGELGQAFNDVQRTAVRSAVEEANVRRGLNEVFLNIARRSQTLLHRQLALLDRMERRETEPQELEDLYRVDHLATRMRRHAEDLVILAGAAPGRGWRNPVPVIDVVRGAISEVEDYKRVDIRAVESSAVIGRAVGDVIHLLAELLENAASYSPPHTRVQVSGQVLPNGYAVEIEDRGLGMTHDALDEANRRLVEPPDFDPADSARLGLFVVAQLASRHGIRVSLRESAYGGITAIVLLPGELVAGGPGQVALPAGPDRKVLDQPLVGSGTADPGRHSLAALQWQGEEQLREITVARRPVIIDVGAVPAPDPEPETAGRGGPMPSSVAAGLSADGLVQRRRVRRPIDLGTSDEAAAEAAKAAKAAGAAEAAEVARAAEVSKAAEVAKSAEDADAAEAALGAEAAEAAMGAEAAEAAEAAGAANAGKAAEIAEAAKAASEQTGTTAANQPALPAATATDAAKARSRRNGPPRGSAPVKPGAARPSRGSAAVKPPVNPTSSAPLFPGAVPPATRPGAPTPAAPMFAAPTSAPPNGGPPPATEPPTTEPPTTEPPTTEDGLPRRIRQASLAPQLRRKADALPDEPTVPLRSPEQVRSIMSALQLGTTRGRIDAARYLPGGGNGDGPESSSEDRPKGEEGGNGVRPDAAGLADAATVSFPAVVNLALADGETASKDGTGAEGDRADGPANQHVTRPEKDA